MFSTKPKETALMGGSTSIIGSGVTLSGDLISAADVRIDGTVKGNIKCQARILIGADGLVEGDVEGQQADIMGTVTGNIKVKDLLNLRGNGKIDGNIYAGKLQMEPTFTFNGHCHMNNNVVVEMIKDKHDKPKTATK